MNKRTFLKKCLGLLPGVGLAMKVKAGSGSIVVPGGCFYDDGLGPIGCHGPTGTQGPSGCNGSYSGPVSFEMHWDPGPANSEKYCMAGKGAEPPLGKFYRVNVAFGKIEELEGGAPFKPSDPHLATEPASLKK